MATFVYQGKKYSGETSRGTIQASSVMEASQLLKKKHIKPLSVVEQEATFANKEITLFSGVKPKLLVGYLQQFSTLINAGITVLEASTMLEEQQQDKNFKKILNEVTQDLENGSTLSDSYKKHPNAFPPLLVNVIAVAEVSGSLESNLKKMADYYEKSSANRSSIVTAMIYPIMMLIASIAVGIFLMVSIVPMFVTVFEDFDAELPAITKLTMSISDFLQTKGIVVVLAILGISIGLFFGKRNPTFRLNYDAMMLKLPGFGELMQKSNFSVFMTTLSSLLGSSVPMVKALEMSGEVVKNTFIKQMVQQCEVEVSQGGRISSIFSNSFAVPLLATQMVKVGESTGSLEDMLEKLSVIYEREVDESTKRIKTIIEPLVLLVICGIVGFIVAAIMLPMFAMYSAVQG
ncbi:type II secretion system F family protein [Vagococcus sp. BWB3-3]|uniref:Type II secretion system F family protein n=1 Tax=Vagococcus allomyrinae TaxID=2794353 RepID=A0A940ST61_9ENTE|nr:type II secretion system F family protein [Vagococcus allomyrinae]MBP1042777.1 type II secretion system F family protein [Vagococcus allomyrinae]